MQDNIYINILDKYYEEMKSNNLNISACDYIHITETFNKLLTSGEILYKKQTHQKSISVPILKSMTSKIGTNELKYCYVKFSNIVNILYNSSTNKFLVCYYVKISELPQEIWNYYHRFGIYGQLKENYYVYVYHTKEDVIKLIDSDPLTNKMFSQYISDNTDEENNEMIKAKLWMKTDKVSIQLGFDLNQETIDFANKIKKYKIDETAKKITYLFDVDYFI